MIPIGTAHSAVGLKTCTLTAAIKKYKSIVKKKRKNHDQIVLLANAKLNTFEVLISKALIDLYNKHHKFILVTIVLREYNETKEEIKNPKTSVEYTIKIWLI